MPIDVEQYEKRLERLLKSFSGHFMSNEKWTKVFRTLSEHCAQVSRCLIKTVWDDNLRLISIPASSNFSETFSDSGINDVMTGGPIRFREIEQLVFPRTWMIPRQMRKEILEPHKAEQDIKAIGRTINQIGLLGFELTEEKFILYGYK